MTVVEMPAGARMAKRWLGGRFRLDERISLDDQVSGFPGPCGSSWEARGFSLWKATDQLLRRPVTIYLLPRGPVPRAVTDAVQAAAKVSDPRRGARHAGRHRLPRPAGTGRRRPAAAADPGRDGHGAPHGAAAVLPAGPAGERAVHPAQRPAAA